MKKIYFLICLFASITISAQTVNVKVIVDATAPGLYPDANYDNLMLNGNFAPGEEWWGWGITLVDDGTGDDAVSGDGIWTGSRDIAENFSYEFVLAGSGPADNWGGWGVQTGESTNSNGNYTFSTTTSDLELNLSVLSVADGNGSWGGALSTNTLSTNDFELNQAKVFPNPSNNFWNVKSHQIIQSINVYDVLGKQVMTVKPNNTEFELNASTLPKGLYFARMTTEVGSGSIKLIKN